MRVNWFFFICLILVIVVVVFPQIGSAAISLTGTTGLVNIPTAYIIPDGKIAFGYGYTDKEYSLYGPKYAQVAYYATAGYFPFLEVSLRVTVFPGLIQPGKYGSAKDRMASVKLRLLNESQYLPSILIGSHDILTIHKKDYLKYYPNRNKRYNDMHFSSEYIVISKSLHSKIFDSLGIHLGYATKLFKEATNYSMGGMFVGVDARLCRFLTIMGEYDTTKYNMGLRITPLGDIANIDLVVLDMKRISGGISFSLGL